MRLSTLSHTLAALAGSAFAVNAADGAYKELKSWQVSCSQTRSCSMRQFISDSPVSGFELQRSGLAEAPVAISVDGGAPVSFENADIAVDANTAALSLSGDFIGNGLIDRLKNGTTAKITISRGRMTAEGEIPLAGAAASLLFIDEFQKRVGHVDAMSAKGDKAPNPSPPVSDIRRFADFPETVRARFAEGGECAETEEAMLDGNALAHKLAEEQTLYVTPCGMGGAYNFPYAVFVEVYGTVSTLPFPTMQEGAPSAATSAFNLSYDYEAKTFSAFFKGRGVGDCGTFNEWKLAEGAIGPQLVLVEEAFRDCPAEIDENETIDIANWPKTWPLR
jgi:hypothetical protein